MSTAVDTTTRGLLTPGDHKHRCPKCHESKFCPHACSPCEDQSEGQAVPHGYYAECEECSKPRATTRSIPYAGVSNPMPRTTAEERKLYEEWERAARRILQSVESDPAASERSLSLCARDNDSIDLEPYSSPSRLGRGVLVSEDSWRAHWRSLPDYDGPPMRAPSGVDYHRVFRADGSSRVALPLRVERPPFIGNEQVAALFGEIDDVSTAWRNNDNYLTVMPRFVDPGKGGRGWCPKLAGVVT